MAIHLYDPLDPAFGDGADARVERDRTFRICSDCRMCVKLCPSFRSLFEMIDDLGGSQDNLKSAVAGETYEYTEMYPGFARTARDEGLEEVAEWLETLARAEKSHAGRFQAALESIS